MRLSIGKITGLLVFLFLLTLFITTSPKKALALCSPAVPAPSLNATKGNTGQVMLTWNPVTNANRYALVYGFENMPFTFGALSIDGGTQTNYTVNFLQPNAKYTFQIWAFCSDGEAPTPSNSVMFIAP